MENLMNKLLKYKLIIDSKFIEHSVNDDFINKHDYIFRHYPLLNRYSFYIEINDHIYIIEKNIISQTNKFKQVFFINDKMQIREYHQSKNIPFELNLFKQNFDKHINSTLY